MQKVVSVTSQAASHLKIKTFLQKLEDDLALEAMNTEDPLKMTKLRSVVPVM